MLIIENGVGLPNAESYASVAAADARGVALSVTDWAALTENQKEIALRNATRFMLASYRARWAGRPDRHPKDLYQQGTATLRSGVRD